jgi:hypothetical protein
VGRIATGVIVVACAVAAVGGAYAAMSPQALRAAIFKAASAKHSVHYVTVSSSSRGRSTMVSDIAADRGIQRVTFSNGGRTGHVTMLVVGSTAYIRGDAFTLHGYMAFPPSLASRYAGRWILIPHTSPLYGPVAIDVTFGSFVRDAMPQGHLTIVAGTVGGRKVRGLHGTAREGGTLTLYVPTSGSLLPLEGKETVRAPIAASSRLTMSRWNEPVRVSAPAHAVPLSH